MLAAAGDQAIELLKTQNKYGNTPLRTAVAKEDADVVKAIVSATDDKAAALLEIKDKDGKAPLRMAIEKVILTLLKQHRSKQTLLICSTHLITVRKLNKQFRITHNHNCKMIAALVCKIMRVQFLMNKSIMMIATCCFIMICNDVQIVPLPNIDLRSKSMFVEKLNIQKLARNSALR